MGNFLSGDATEGAASTLNNNTTSESETMEDSSCLHDNEMSVIEEEFHDTLSDDEEKRAKLKEEEMNEFRKELGIKREQRKEILARHRAEKTALENALQNEIDTKVELCENNQLLRELLIKNNIHVPENLHSNSEKSYIAVSISHMREEIEKLRSSNVKLRYDLATSNSALQTAYTDIADLSAQNTESIKQVKALKEVISVSKTMITLREQQLNELKSKLNEIEQSLADRETTMLSTDLRQEYERQLQNIRTLRGLYEERARLADVSRQALARDLDEHKLLLETEVKKSEDLAKKVDDLEAKLVTLEESVKDKNNMISTNQEEVRRLKAEMLGINKLFSQALMGYQSKQNLDKLVLQLEENHGLLTHMAGREDCPEVSTELPKLLLEIVNQIDEKDDNNSNGTCINEVNTDNDTNKSDISKAEEIVQNLPKVWRVLMELLSHHSEADAEAETSKKVTTCYKTVETKSGSVQVPSVSQTYIRLKDLILEKLTLIKEVSRMKQLNTHLESRLEEQERRLCLVTNELSKTWHVVGRLRRHHHQLHTHEKILKYELQQKRKLLNELKEELEYCREKWEQAREKNTQSEKDWRKLRTEFSNRKLKPEASFNNSAESGYSDERPSDSESNDENEYELKIKCKKKNKKSFETIIDSSTDVNLAEREDPASDMLDIADLPLDTQDNAECLLDSSTSERPKVDCFDETEDEVGDMINDLYIDEQSVTENIQFITHESRGTNNSFNPGSNSDITRKENDRLLKYDNLAKDSESSSSGISQNSQILEINTNNVQVNQGKNMDTASVSTEVRNVNEQSNKKKIINNVEKNTVTKILSDNNVECASAAPLNDESLTIDFAEILKNVRKQNDRLQLKDKRLDNLESGCSSVISHMSNTVQLGNDMIAKLDTLHTKHDTTDQNKSEEMKEDDPKVEKKQIDSEEASTSQDMDHEARFAARELRLKRLEEQTKYLVNKVNKTASKGVKIHYKLEELHNIYGSENSRSGTPSEDTSDISQHDDDVQND